MCGKQKACVGLLADGLVLGGWDRLFGFLKGRLWLLFGLICYHSRH